MADRRLYVYRLEVEHPTDRPPPTPEWADGIEDYYPAWPVARRYLSQTGAERRARLLRSMGCTVTVTRSEPVVFGCANPQKEPEG